MIKDLYNTHPADLQAGDVLLATVKLMVIQGAEGLTYRVYRCCCDLATEPQGAPITRVAAETIQEAVFPVVTWAEIKLDPYC